MENNKINNELKTISTSARNCKVFSILEIFGLLFVIISLILFGVSYNKWNYIISFNNYIESILKNGNPWNNLEIGAYATFIIGMVFISIGFLGTFICALVLINHNNFLVECGQDSISSFAIVTIFLGVLTGIPLENKTHKIVNKIKNNLDKIDVAINEPIKPLFQTNKSLTIKDTKIDFSNEKHIDKLKEKLTNLQKLKKEGFINDYEYTELKEKIIIES